jgi:multidrug efflux pump subunit AcrA (membrane-fusion protein)
MTHPTTKLLLLAALAACGTPTSPALPEQAAPIATVAAAAPAVELVGVITTRRSAVVSAEFEARVARILVTSGQRVRTGDPLVQLDDSQIRQRVEAARHAEDAAHSKMLSQGALVASTARRLAIEKQLYSRGAQAREAVTTARFELSSSGAAAAAAKSEYQAASSSRVELEQQLAKAILLAPMDGTVTVIKVKEGEIARSGTKVARVFDPQDLRVQFELPRSMRNQLAVGAMVDVLVDGVVLRAPVVEISADLEPPLQFAIATADLADDATAQTARVGAEVRVRFAKAAPMVNVRAPAPAAAAAVAAAVPVAAAAPAPVAAAPAAAVAAPAAPATVAAAPLAAAPGGVPDTSLAR